MNLTPLILPLLNPANSSRSPKDFLLALTLENPTPRRKKNSRWKRHKNNPCHPYYPLHLFHPHRTPIPFHFLHFPRFHLSLMEVSFQNRRVLIFLPLQCLHSQDRWIRKRPRASRGESL